MIELLHGLFGSGRIVDLILALVAVEALALTAYHRVTSRGVAGLDLLANLASGICLLLALRAALTGQSWIWVALALSASLLGHLLDLSRRWKRAPQANIANGGAGSDYCAHNEAPRFGVSAEKIGR